MNNGKNFSKMCECLEIKKQWKPKVGDRVAKKATYEEGYIDDYDSLESRLVVNGVTCPKRHPSDLFIWLPNENQLKEMTDFSEEDFNHFINKEPYYSRGGSGAPAKDRFGTPEELLLAYVMKRKYGKCWRILDWGTC